MKKDWLYKLGILITCAACIIYFLPREKEFSYPYEVGRPWPYGQLMADFDFPIYKTQATIEHETDSVLREFIPYFGMNDSIGHRQTAALEEKLAKVIPFDEVQRIHIIRAMDEMYEKGVISMERHAQLSEDSVQTLSIYRGAQAFKRDLSEVYTTKSAYEHLFSDSLHLNGNVLRQCVIADYILPNLQYDTERSEEYRNELMSSISFTTGLVFAGTRMVERGEIVTPRIDQILQSWLRAGNTRFVDSNQDRLYQLIGHSLFVTIVLLCYILYINTYRRDYYLRQRTMLLLFGMIVLFSVATSLMVRSNLLSVYVLPYAMVPIIVRILMDSRTAFMTTVVLTVVSSICLRFPYEFMMLQLVSGVTSILSLREMTQRSQLVRTAGIITLANIIFYFSYDLIHANDLSKMDISMYKYLCINGVLLLFAYPLLYMLEKMFGFTSDVTLVELSNINNPVLLKLSEVAPGTFQHSLQVANLAAEAARKVGAKAQLVRTGALYHDIGKLSDPAFFTENQSGVNPHNNLTEKQSASIIINHVHYGLKLAEKYNLPAIITDFIRTHHGEGMAKYFYINYQNSHPDEEVDKADFSYPGPNPQTKEQAILMMADAVEASSRSLPQYTEETISRLVDKIVDGQVADGFFHLCPITFLDIEMAKRVFKDKLKTIYHTRISYPELRK